MPYAIPEEVSEALGHPLEVPQAASQQQAVATRPQLVVEGGGGGGVREIAMGTAAGSGAYPSWWNGLGSGVVQGNCYGSRLISLEAQVEEPPPGNLIH